jgi:hypothetical protein
MYHTGDEPCAKNSKRPTAEHDDASSGLVGVNMEGQMLSTSVDEQTIIPYILTTSNNTELAFKMASRANLPAAVSITNSSRAADSAKLPRWRPILEGT